VGRSKRQRDGQVESCKDMLGFWGGLEKQLLVGSIGNVYGTVYPEK